MTKQPSSSERIGVLLFNLGGPDTLDDVRPFLFNLFADPDIIRLPWRFLQKPLAWMISTQRYKKSRTYYEKIGGGSPLRRITDEQARSLEAALATRGIDARAYVAMRYWKPYTEEALEQIARGHNGDGLNDGHYLSVRDCKRIARDALARFRLHRHDGRRHAIDRARDRRAPALADARGQYRAGGIAQLRGGRLGRAGAADDRDDEEGECGAA